MIAFLIVYMIKEDFPQISYKELDIMNRRKNIVKRIFIVILALTLLTSFSVNAASVPNPAHTDGVQTINTKYMLSASVNFQDLSNQQKITIETSAFVSIDKIYHEVTVYKNGELITDQTYEDYNTADLKTNLYYSAQSGDSFAVYVNHYTLQGGYLESAYSEEYHTFY